jgi:hypothetical protein
MAYVIITANGDEIDRRELTAPVTIGRAQDADVPIRDILLSRKHCRLEPTEDGHWRVVDLGSKNGTFLGYRTIKQHELKDGDELSIGRTRVTFKDGPFEPAPEGTRRRQQLVRPADPTEALAGTVAGFTLVEPGEVEREAGAPVPQPRPPEPTSYASEDVYGMLNEIASSSWDSIMAQASRPLVMERPLPRPDALRAPRVISRTRVAFSLQAPVQEPTIPTEPSETGVVAQAASCPPEEARNTRWLSTRRWWAIPPKARRSITLGVLSALATALLAGAWIASVYQGPQPSMAAPTYKYRRVPQTDRKDLVDITFPSILAQPNPYDELAQQAGAKTPHLDLSLPPSVTLRNAARIAAMQFFSLP